MKVLFLPKKYFHYKKILTSKKLQGLNYPIKAINQKIQILNYFFLDNLTSRALVTHFKPMGHIYTP